MVLEQQHRQEGEQEHEQGGLDEIERSHDDGDGGVWEGVQQQQHTDTIYQEVPTKGESVPLSPSVGDTNTNEKINLQRHHQWSN